MNVYDWDNTIYRGDSTFGFVCYLYRHKPKTLLSIPRTLGCGLLYGLHIMSKLAFKENLYHMFVFVDDMPKQVEAFTSSHLDHVKKWYVDQQKEDDLVISASPEFLIASFCEKVNIKHYMASKVDIHTGKYSGLNCHGEEKVRRVMAIYNALELRPHVEHEIDTEFQKARGYLDDLRVDECQKTPLRQMLTMLNDRKK